MASVGFAKVLQNDGAYKVSTQTYRHPKRFQPNNLACKMVPIKVCLFLRRPCWKQYINQVAEPFVSWTMGTPFRFSRFWDQLNTGDVKDIQNGPLRVRSIDTGVQTTTQKQKRQLKRRHPPIATTPGNITMAVGCSKWSFGQSESSIPQKALSQDGGLPWPTNNHQRV